LLPRRRQAAGFDHPTDLAEPSRVTEAFPPNKALEAFGPFIGTWRTSGSHPMILGTVHGITRFEWHEEGAFVVMRSSIEEAVGIPRGVAIIGSDGGLNKMSMLYYDQRGVSRLMQASLEGHVFRWWRDDPKFSQRYTLTLAEDGQSIVGKGESSTDGGPWEKDLDLNYSKVQEEGAGAGAYR
jgi:hypothetical protein